MSTENSNNDPRDRGMNININSVRTGTGHIIISNGDVNIRGNIRGDEANIQTITVGGVETTEQEFESLKSSLNEVDRAIQETILPQDDIEAAQHNADILRTQMTSERKPNATMLAQSAEQLYRFGPKIAGTIVALFTNPLAGQIVTMAGERALQTYRRLREEGPDSVPPITSAPPSTPPLEPGT